MPKYPTLVPNPELPNADYPAIANVVANMPDGTRSITWGILDPHRYRGYAITSFVTIPKIREFNPQAGGRFIIRVRSGEAVIQNQYAS
jgi:hypothetical protein